MESDDIILGVELRSCHPEGLLDGGPFGFKIVLVAFVVDEDIIEVEQKSVGLKHLVGSRLHRPELVWQLEVIGVISVVVCAGGVEFDDANHRRYNLPDI